MRLISTKIIGVAALLADSSPSLAAGDAAAGKQTFTTTCGICHSTEPGVNKIGPSLAGIVGSKSGGAPGYNFSPALQGANITWDEQTLDKFLENPLRLGGGNASSCPLRWCIAAAAAHTWMMSARLLSPTIAD